MLCLLVAALLQTIDLGEKSLWFDEVASARIAEQRALDDSLSEVRVTERQPPLHPLLLHGWRRIVGGGDARLRLLSALLSIASVALFARLAQRVAGRRIALYATWLLSISPALLLFGRMARYYSLSLFLALLATLALVEALGRTQPGSAHRVAWAGYGVAGTLLLLTTYVGIAVVASHLATAVLVALHRRDRSDRWRFARAAALPAVLLVAGILWIAFGFERTHELAHAQWPETPTSGALGIVLKATYPLLVFGTGATLFPWEPLALVALAVLAIAIVAGLRSLARSPPWGWLAAICLIGTLGATILALELGFRDLPFLAVPSRALPALPFFLLLAAAGLARLPKAWSAAALACLTAAAAAAAHNYFSGRHLHSPIYAAPTREVADRLRRQLRPADAVITSAGVALERYLRPSAGRLIAVDSDGSAEGSGGCYSARLFANLAARAPRTTQPRVIFVTASPLLPELVGLRQSAERRSSPPSIRRHVPLDAKYRSVMRWLVKGHVPATHALTVTTYALEPALVRRPACGRSRARQGLVGRFRRLQLPRPERR